MAVPSWILTALVLVAAPSARAIMNGTEVPESFHPEVKMLSFKNGLCTGTMVGPRAMITAAHCVEGMLKSGVMGLGGRKVSIKVDGVAADAHRIHPRYGKKGDGFQAFDIAVVRFKSNFANYARIARRAALAGDPVTVVGFGMSMPGAGDTAKVKRAGSNRVAMADLGQLVLAVPPGDTRSAIGTHGDSGGPLFNWLGELAGTTKKFADISRTLQASYIDVADPEVAEFLRQAFRELGVEVPGY